MGAELQRLISQRRAQTPTLNSKPKVSLGSIHINMATSNLIFQPKTARQSTRYEQALGYTDMVARFYQLKSV